ncbi:MAG: UMP kinase [Parcubacteria group bacterium]|nr:UMP kinase [Parcubacteria group bacterium]
MENKKIVIKLSGEALAGNSPGKYSEEVLRNIADQILELRAKNIQVAIVVGGGNLFRGRELTGVLSIERATADYIGMLATVQNALVLRDYFESRGIETRVSSAIAMRQVCEEFIPKRAERNLEKGRVVIFAAGLGAPYFSTDSTAVQRSLEIGAELLVMAKNNVDGIYSADPKLDSSAKKIDRITCSKVLAQNLKVADLSAIALAKENGLKMKVVAISEISSVLNTSIGSVVEPE